MRTIPLLALASLAACGSPPPRRAPVAHRAAEIAPAEPPLPCGATTIDDLYPSGRDHVGACAVVREGEYVTLVDDGQPVMRAADAKPLQLLDPRVPGPSGIRVGMIGSEVQAQAPSHGFIACTNFGDLMQCELRRTAIAPECTSPDFDDVIYLRFPPPGSRADGVEYAGAAAWDAIADSKVSAILLTMPC